MKLETLERFLNKDQDTWDLDDISKITGKYGKNAIFYDTDGITNSFVALFKFRDMINNDETISDFIKFKNDDYSYIINFIRDYTSKIELIQWPTETPLQKLYRILCERFLNDIDIANRDDISKELKELSYYLYQTKEKWLKFYKDKLTQNKEDIKNESK